MRRTGLWRAPFWLAHRELLARRGALAAGTAVVAVVVSFCVGAELLARAKAQAVRTELDRMGPAMRLIPAGTTAADLARFEFADAEFSATTLADIQAAIASLCRTLDRRLLTRQSVDGKDTPVAGVDPSGLFSSSSGLAGFAELAGDGVVLGSELARAVGRSLGEEVAVGGRALRVTGILDEAASVEDFAAFQSLKSLQGRLGRPQAINLIDVYPRQGIPMEDVARRLAPLRSRVNVLLTDQDRSAIGDMEQGLEQHRRALYLVTAFVIAICILIWSYLNAVEKRTEVATLVALGSSTSMVLLTLASQAAIVGFTGAFAGYALAVVAVLAAHAEDLDSVRGVVFSLPLLLAMEAGVVVACVLGSIPAALLAAFQKHVAVLQES